MRDDNFDEGAQIFCALSYLPTWSCLMISVCFMYVALSLLPVSMVRYRWIDWETPLKYFDITLITVSEDTTAREHPYHVIPVLMALKNAQLDCKYLGSASEHISPPRAKTMLSKEILDSFKGEPRLKAGWDCKGYEQVKKLTGAYVEWANNNVKDDVTRAEGPAILKSPTLWRSASLLRTLPLYPS